MPTASQIMAAKKQAKAAAKIARQAKQQIGTGRVQGDRNRRANIEYRQHCNRRDLREGRPCGRDSAVTDEIRSWLAYGELVYGHHTPAVTVFEKLIRAMRCVAGIKMPELRTGILEAAWCLYRIAECFEDMDEPQAVPDLRRPQWQPFGNPETLQGMIREMVEKWMIPFENHTGLTLIDFKRFRQRLIDIDVKHAQAA